MHPNRTGGFVACVTILPESAARNGNDSSHGNASETPAPRKKARLVNG